MSMLNSNDYYQDFSWGTQEEAHAKAVEEEYDRQRREAERGERHQGEERTKKK